jgi:hypothetical protein
VVSKLGGGSGIDTQSLASSLVDAERAPRQAAGAPHGRAATGSSAGPGRAGLGRGEHEGQPWSQACQGGVAARARAECDAWCEEERGDRGAGRATISCQPVAAVVRGSRAGSCRDIQGGGGTKISSRVKRIFAEPENLPRQGESHFKNYQDR